MKNSDRAMDKKEILYGLLTAIYLCSPIDLIPEAIVGPLGKVIHTKYSKHCPYTVAHTFDCVCSKINHGLSILLLKLINCPIHWIVYR